MNKFNLIAMNQPQTSKKRKNFWSQPLRVESPDIATLSTARCIDSALWFVNNPKLEERIYAFLAKYVEKHEVELYSFILVGNHYHLVAKFPKENASQFYRDFNARIAESVRIYVDDFTEGPLFKRRYSSQALPLNVDIENYFFYCALQAVSSGLCQKISDYPGYNFFNDAVRGVNRKYKYFMHAEYGDAKRNNSKVSKKDFWSEHTLKFSRLPGHEELSQREYIKLMHNKLEERRLTALKKLEKRGYLTKDTLKKVKPGSLPASTKKGGRRPIVLTCCKKAWKNYISFYFSVVERFKNASEKFRNGDLTVEFPKGTYKPHGMTMVVPP